jgi:O-antigen biosynthesis protein
MAFRTDVLRRLGGFDLALGPATPAKGGEDLAALFDVVANGYQLAYVPGAIVYHPHRRDYDALRNQLYGYGMGLTAYLTRTLCERPLRTLEVLGKVPYGLYFTLSPHSKKNAKKAAGYPAELSKMELRGMLAGPWCYLRGRFGWGV